MADDEYDPKDIKHLQRAAKREVFEHPEHVTCLRCGWVSFAISREEAERQVAEFNAYYTSLSDDRKAMYGSPSSIDRYSCLQCGGTEFRQAKDGDCPNGVTLNPVICDEFADFFRKFADNADDLAASILSAISGKGHGSLVGSDEFAHLVTDSLSPLHIHAVFERLERERRLFRLDRLQLWAASLDGRAPDIHVVAGMLAKAKDQVLGFPKEIEGGWRYRWGTYDLTIVFEGIVLEFVRDEDFSEGTVH